MLEMFSKSFLQNHLVQFMRLQICAHHPLGAHEDDEGGWSTSVKHWKVFNCGGDDDNDFNMHKLSDVPKAASVVKNRC